MYLTSEIVKDTLAARRFRLLAPLAVLLALVALTLAPSAQTHSEDSQGSVNVRCWAHGSDRLSPGLG
jgi:hypothetical protein